LARALINLQVLCRGLQFIEGCDGIDGHEILARGFRINQRGRSIGDINEGWIGPASRVRGLGLVLGNYSVHGAYTGPRMAEDWTKSAKRKLSRRARRDGLNVLVRKGGLVPEDRGAKRRRSSA